MAVSIVQTNAFKNSELITISMTADGDADLSLPDKSFAGITFQSDGNDGTGTLTVLVSNDGDNFVAAGFTSAADPVSTTPVTSITAAGAWVMPTFTLGWTKVRFHLTGATNPTLHLYVRLTYRGV